MCELCDGLHKPAKPNLDFLKEAKVSKPAPAPGLCCVPIREEIHCALEAIYFQIGMEVKPGDRRDKLFMAANILNDFLKGKTT